MKLYNNFEESFFVERENRFVLQLKKKNGERIKAYIANPGRMEEFLVKDHPFFITAGNKGKYFYRVVSTYYQDSFILLDTIKINALVEMMLKNDRIESFTGPKSVRREVSVSRSKFDFLVERENRRPSLLEVKSCSLCHRGVAMFPDAPTLRGQRHLEDLEELAAGIYDCHTLYVINHKDARTFMPNWHTDMEYARRFKESKRICFSAYCIRMTDPVTLDPEFFKAVPVDMERTAANCRDKGGYLMVFCNEEPFNKVIGSLGERKFEKGYYVYAGSAMQGLEKRIKRHLKKNKKIRWHLDYISPYHMKALKVYPIMRKDRIEEHLVQGLLRFSPGYVEGFGASDSEAPSHFFYFPDRPYRRRDFLDLLLDARMLLRRH
jgi:sugar fermentation stimulation protein A